MCQCWMRPWPPIIISLCWMHPWPPMCQCQCWMHPWPPMCQCLCVNVRRMHPWPPMCQCVNVYVSMLDASMTTMCQCLCVNVGCIHDHPCVNVSMSMCQCWMHPWPPMCQCVNVYVSMLDALDASKTTHVSMSMRQCHNHPCVYVLMLDASTSPMC
jgi:hypothetical protein